MVEELEHLLGRCRSDSCQWSRPGRPRRRPRSGRNLAQNARPAPRRITTRTSSSSAASSSASDIASTSASFNAFSESGRSIVSRRTGPGPRPSAPCRPRRLLPGRADANGEPTRTAFVPPSLRDHGRWNRRARLGPDRPAAPCDQATIDTNRRRASPVEHGEERGRVRRDPAVGAPRRSVVCLERASRNVSVYVLPPRIQISRSPCGAGRNRVDPPGRDRHRPVDRERGLVLRDRNDGGAPRRPRRGSGTPRAGSRGRGRRRRLRHRGTGTWEARRRSDRPAGSRPRPRRAAGPGDRRPRARRARRAALVDAREVRRLVRPGPRPSGPAANRGVTVTRWPSVCRIVHRGVAGTVADTSDAEPTRSITRSGRRAERWREPFGRRDPGPSDRAPPRRAYVDPTSGGR